MKIQSFMIFLIIAFILVFVIGAITLVSLLYFDAFNFNNDYYTENNNCILSGDIHCEIIGLTTNGVLHVLLINKAPEQINDIEVIVTKSDEYVSTGYLERLKKDESQLIKINTGHVREMGEKMDGKILISYKVDGSNTKKVIKGDISTRYNIESKEEIVENKDCWLGNTYTKDVNSLTWNGIKMIREDIYVNLKGDKCINNKLIKNSTITFEYPLLPSEYVVREKAMSHLESTKNQYISKVTSNSITFYDEKVHGIIRIGDKFNIINKKIVLSEIYEENKEKKAVIQIENNKGVIEKTLVVEKGINEIYIDNSYVKLYVYDIFRHNIVKSSYIEIAIIEDENEITERTYKPVSYNDWEYTPSLSFLKDYGTNIKGYVINYEWKYIGKESTLSETPKKGCIEGDAITTDKKITYWNNNIVKGEFSYINTIGNKCYDNILSKKTIMTFEEPLVYGNYYVRKNILDVSGTETCYLGKVTPNSIHYYKEDNYAHLNKGDKLGLRNSNKKIVFTEAFYEWGILKAIIKIQNEYGYYEDSFVVERGRNEIMVDNKPVVIVLYYIYKGPYSYEDYIEIATLSYENEVIGGLYGPVELDDWEVIGTCEFINENERMKGFTLYYDREFIE